MKQFNFQFQKILDLKGNEKDLAKMKMADAIKREEEGYRKNEVIYNKMAEIENLKKEKQKQGIHISELRMLDHYIQQLQVELDRSNRELKLLQSNVARSKTQLQKKAQEEKTWVNLKNDQRSKYDEQSKLAEQNFFDEMASNRFYRASIVERG